MKLGLKVGVWLNNYIQSYGYSWVYRHKTLWIRHPMLIVWPRRNFVRFICEILSCIDEKEYKACRSTVVYKEQLVNQTQ